MARIVIEIQPETPISVVWRLYAVEGPTIDGALPREQRMLRKGAMIYGGTLRQAHQDAVHVAQENGFLYRPPADLNATPEGQGLVPGGTIALPPGPDKP